MLLRAIETRTFLPLGSDREVTSDFQLLAGTNRELPARVREGRFRDDLLSRINLWTFRLPALSERREDIEPNLSYELDRCRETLGLNVTFNRPARKRFLEFSMGEAVWPGNFRDLGAAVTRMATLAPGGRVDVATVDEELGRLRASSGSGDVWRRSFSSERAFIVSFRARKMSISTARYWA
jgi:transcriptional regulatory protein RtcR